MHWCYCLSCNNALNKNLQSLSACYNIKCRFQLDCLGTQAPTHIGRDIVKFIIIFIDWIARRVKDWLVFRRKILLCTEFRGRSPDLCFKLSTIRERNLLFLKSPNVVLELSRSCLRNQLKAEVDDVHFDKITRHCSTKCYLAI